MAVHQLPDGPPDLLLAFGPGEKQFQDFVEGVRLVTGEKSVIGLSSLTVFTRDLFLTDGGLVVAIQSGEIVFSPACSRTTGQDLLAGSTSLFTQFRRSRRKIPDHRFR